MPTPIILDTDPGDDIDDAFAIALCAVSPELDLRAVTTVYGDTVERARLARSILVRAGRGDVPVAAGCADGMSVRHRGGLERLTSHKGFNQVEASLPESALPPCDRRHAVELIIDTIMAGNGDVVPVTIGAMTNLAMAIVKEPRLRQRIPRIVCMAAEFQRNQPEWNIICDPVAADIVFSSGIPLEVSPWTIGFICTMTQAEVDRIANDTGDLAVIISACTKRWMDSHPGRRPHLYDPVAVAGIIDPTLCTWQTGTVTIETAGTHTFGYSRFVRGEGPHRIHADVDRDRAMSFILDRLCGKRLAKASA